MEGRGSHADKDDGLSVPDRLVKAGSLKLGRSRIYTVLASSICQPAISSVFRVGSDSDNASAMP